MRTRRPVLLAVPALAAALALGGCSAVDNIVQGAVDGVTQEVQDQVDQAVQEALGGAGISTDGELPPNFPAEQVPLVDATLVGGAAGPEGSGWAVQLTLDDIAQFDEASQLLQDAGYTVRSENADAESANGNYTGNGYTVNVTVTSDGGALSALYVVIPDGSSAE
jgi:hypothetical protein